MKIMMAGCAGAAHVGQIARLRKDELMRRYPESFIEKAGALKGIEDAPARCRQLKALVRYIAPVGTEGIYAALWEMARELDTGIEIDMRAIPIYQETVEIMEFFDMKKKKLNFLY